MNMKKDNMPSGAMPKRTSVVLWDDDLRKPTRHEYVKSIHSGADTWSHIYRSVSTGTVRVFGNYYLGRLLLN